MTKYFMARQPLPAGQRIAGRRNAVGRRLAVGGAIAAVAAGLTGCAPDLQPLTTVELGDRVANDRMAMFADQDPVAGSIDIYEAVARGLKYNLDKKLKLYELALARKGLDYTATGMLPQLVLSAGYRGRDSFRGSSSKSLITGAESLEVSTSEDRNVGSVDLTMVWNVLDFGLTYLRARQDADRVLIAEERRIKVVQNLIQDIRHSYWRAVAAERMSGRVDRLIGEVERAIGRSRSVQGSGSGEPADELAFQRALLESLSDLKNVKRQLALAKSELAGLMNLPPGTRFSVVAPKSGKLRIPHLKANTAELTEAALLNRPELREEDLKKRISLTELDAAWVRLLPGLELSAGTNFDSNSFLFEHNWQSAAAALTKNIMELVMAERSIGFAEADVAVADQRRLTLSMAIIAQLHISLQRYALATDLFDVSARLYLVDREIADVAHSAKADEQGSEQKALVASARKAVSELNYYSAYADVQNAFGRILSSIGSHRIPSEIDDLDVATLRLEVKAFLDDWQPPVAAIQLAGLR